MLYKQLVAASDLSPEFSRRIDHFKAGSGTFRMIVALSELPDFTVLPGKEKAEVLRDFGRPISTYDTGDRVAWIYRRLAYDPVLEQYKDVTVWFDKYGFVDRISER